MITISLLKNDKNVTVEKISKLPTHIAANTKSSTVDIADIEKKSGIIAGIIIACIVGVGALFYFNPNISKSFTSEKDIETTNVSETAAPNTASAETEETFIPVNNETENTFNEPIHTDTEPSVETENTSVSTLDIITENDTTGENWIPMHVVSQHTYFYPEPSDREKPSESRAVYKDDNVEVLSKENGYYYARTASGNGSYMYGYVKEHLLESGFIDKNISDSTEYKTVTVNVATCKLRSSPNKDTEDNVIRLAKEGEVFDVISFDGYWFEIKDKGKTAYVSYKMVSAQT